MITLKNLSLYFANRPIFDEINATILQEDRIGLVGSNGAGKTTLLRTLAHEQDLDGGAVLYGPHVRIGYLPQDGLIAHGRSLFAEVESAATEVLAVQAKQAALEETLRTLPDTEATERARLIEEISTCDDELMQLDAYRLPSEIETILLGLGFKITDMDRATSEF
ncbi:MAG TPA: ATP-binding cassette domain-containing protein, partial [Opitutales bacterium]|nr:ATP-binding cassette domain-containing protein [Opitutales bacterium]